MVAVAVSLQLIVALSGTSLLQHQLVYALY